MKLKNLILAALAGTVTSAAFAATPVTVVITGSTAFRDAAYDRTLAMLTGETQVNGANSNIRSFTNGSITIGATTYAPVDIHFSLTGSGAGLQALVTPVNLPLAVGGTGQASAAFSDVFPETAGNKSSFYNTPIPQVGVVPFVLVYKPALSPTMNFTGLSQRQLSKLFASSGTLPTGFFGGTGETATNDIIYLCGRNSESGSRLCTDACAYFTGTAANYQWNAGTSTWDPTTQPLGGYDAGSKVNADLNVGPYGIGYVAPADGGGLSRLNYNGVTMTPVSVQKGYYELWGYEHVATAKAGSTKSTADQAAIINALIAAIQAPTWQNDPLSVYQAKGFVPQDAMEVSRTTDGGQIDSLIY